MRRFDGPRFRRTVAVQKLRRIQVGKERGPTLLLDLAAEAHLRLNSTPGRPTDSRWNIRRLIPMRSADWDQLTKLGQRIGVTPAHLATLLLERGLSHLLEDSVR